MDNTRRYTFRYIENCNMCDSLTSSHKILGKRLNRSQGLNPKSKIGISTTVMRCSNCGLIYSNPQPIPNNLHDHYGVLPEEYWNDAYFELDDGYFFREIEILKSLYKFQLGDKALDVGAGIGKCMTSLEKAGFDVYGIEASEQFFQRAIKTGIRPDKIRLSTIENAAFPPEHFDFITFGAVLEHLYDPSSAIAQSLKWLKPSGIIHIEVPSSKWFIASLINVFYKLQGLDYVSNISPMHEPYHLYEFTLKSFEENALINHYKIVHHEYYVANTYMPQALNFILKPLMKYTNTGMQLCVWLSKTGPNGNTTELKKD